jgi:hypothetical protein
VIKKPWLRFFSLTLLLLLIASGSGIVSAQDGSGSKYFSQTGHYITGEFLEKYTSVEDPYLFYGYPITDAFIDSSGVKVQYFEKARFELHPQSAPELRVHVSHLGVFIYTPGEMVPIPATLPKCLDFQEVPYQVCYDFQEFFEQHGGVAQFGYPISNLESHDSMFVQYFQQARFEWHPGLPPGERVRLTDLGRRYFNKTGEDPRRLRPNTEMPDYIIQEPSTSVKVRAFASEPVMGLNGWQTLFVIVQNQNLIPVDGAETEVVVLLPDGSKREFNMPVTNQMGYSEYRFTINSQSQGLARILVETSYGTFNEATRSSFIIWW